MKCINVTHLCINIDRYMDENIDFFVARMQKVFIAMASWLHSVQWHRRALGYCSVGCTAGGVRLQHCAVLPPGWRGPGTNTEQGHRLCLAVVHLRGGADPERDQPRGLSGQAFAFQEVGPFSTAKQMVQWQVFFAVL